MPNTNGLHQRKERHYGIVWLAMFGSLYKISDEDMEDEKETKNSIEEGQVSLLLKAFRGQMMHQS